ALGARGAYPGELLHLGREAAAAHRDGAVVGLVGRGVPHALALLPRTLHLGVQPGEVSPIVLQDVELARPFRHGLIVDLVGRELSVDPAEHAARGDTLDLAGPGAGGDRD